MSDITEQEAVAAKVALDEAIVEFYRIVEPGAVVTAWVMVAHKMSAEMDAEGTSSVGTLVMTGQPFPMTRGLLDVGLEGSRNEVWGDDEDE